MDRLFISSASVVPEEPKEPVERVVIVDMKAQQLARHREARIQELQSLLASSDVADAVPVPGSNTDIT
eukprot:7419496-Heterocapsa_arctica.AAC.1